MADASIADKMAAQNEAIGALAREIDVKIDGLAREIDVKIGAQNEVIGSLRAILVEHGNAIRSMDERHAAAMKSMDERHAAAMKSMETKFETQYNRLVDHQLKLLWFVAGAAVLAMVSPIAKWVGEALGL